MPPPGRVTLIGTGHVFDLEAAVTGAIEAIRPPVVGVELDAGRLRALAARAAGEGAGQKPGGGKRQARAPMLHRILEAYQRRIAADQGTEAGNEMLAAAKAAEAVGARIALLDRPAEETLRRVLREVTWKERGRFLGVLVAGPARATWARVRRRGKSSGVEADIRRYQDDPVAALAELERTFPTVYRVMIDERDEIMAYKLRNVSQRGLDVVAVVGDGHVEGLQKRLQDLDVTVYRLDAVRDGRLPKPAAVLPGQGGADAATRSTYSWGFDTSVS